MRISISYNLPKDADECLQILASHQNLLKGEYALSAVRSYLNQVRQLEGYAETLPVPVGMILVCDKSLLALITDIAKRYHYTKSEIIRRCVKAEIKTKIRRWNCDEPKQFLEIMRSQTPLDLLRSA